MTNIHGPEGFPHTPREIQEYEKEYKKSVKLFQEAVQHYAESDNPYQKKEFQEVMNKALCILNETARELNNQRLLEQNETIEKDYASFNKSPKDKKTIAQLNKDLDKAKTLID